MYEKETLRIPLIWDDNHPLYPQLAGHVCTLGIYVNMLQLPDESSLDYTIIDRNDISMSHITAQRPGAQIQPVSDKERWEIMSRELAQTQALINRLMREHDDKQQQLKNTGEEIVSMRETINILKKDNEEVLFRCQEEEEVEKEPIVSDQVRAMGPDEIKVRLLNVLKNYRNERARNEEFEKVIAAARAEVHEAKSLKSEYDKISERHLRRLKKLQKIQTAVERGKLYQSTIQKQERIILRIEGVLDSVLTNVNTHKQNKESVNDLKQDIGEMTQRMREVALGNTDEGRLQQAREEYERLSQLARELRQQAQGREGRDYADQDMESERLRLEIELQKASLRAESMEEEMKRNTVKFAKEIAQYKVLISELEGKKYAAIVQLK